MHFRYLLLPALAFACCVSFAGQAKRHIEAVLATSPPAIDGEVTKPTWQSAAKSTNFTDFITGGLAEDQTEVFVLYDDKFLYVGFDCHDNHPEQITARETVRDAKFQNNNGPNNTEDNVEIDLDPFLTHSNLDISRFSVNAIGTRSALIAGGRGSKAEWKGDWDAATKRTPGGWSCTMRIPWLSFHYPTGRDKVSIGINFTRYLNRTRAMHEWSATGPQGFLENEGLWVDVSVPKATFKRKLSMLPYVLGGDRTGQIGGKVGLDARYTITPQLTSVATINPDYSNIEGSIQSVSFSHAVHSIAETRPFFLEGGNDFNGQINLNDIGAFFYSPAIQAFDAGAKLYGKITPNDTIGALDTWSGQSRNDAVSRYVHSFNPTTTAGATVVTTSSPDASTTVAMTDSHFRWGKLAFESEVAGTAGPGAGGGAELFSTYYADKVLTSCLQFSGISNDFLTPDGYFPYTGYRGFVGVEDLSYNWRHGFWRSAELTLVPIMWDAMDGSPYYHGLQSSYNMTTKTDWYMEADYYRFVFEGLPDNYVNLFLQKGFTNRFFQIGMQGQTGVEGGARTTAIGPSASFRVLKKLDLIYSGLIQNRLGQIQQHILTANYELSPTRSFGGRAVSQDGDTNLYLFYHNSGGKGTEFYLLYGDPDARKTVNSLQVKFVFSF